jgi:hypothetical protein
MCQCIVGPYCNSSKLRRAGGGCGHEGIRFYQYLGAVANLELRIFSADTHRHMKGSSRLYVPI